MKKQRWLTVWATLLMLTVLQSVVFASTEEITVQKFSLESSEKNPKQLVANIQFNYQISDYMRESLLNGITLRNEVKFDLVWHSDWWFNKDENLTTIITELKYHALSRQYQIVRKDTEENWNFSNLSSALEYIGKIKNFELPALPETAYKDNASIYIEAVLEPKASSLPLNFSAVFSNKNRLVSQGVMWPITPAITP